VDRFEVSVVRTVPARKLLAAFGAIFERHDRVEVAYTSNGVPHHEHGAMRVWITNDRRYIPRM
jgi:hypothetical protein